MIQKHIFTFVLVLIALQIFGQTLKVSSELGIKGGALYTGLKNQYDSPIMDYQSKSGFSIGVFYRLNDIIGPINFQAELLYQLKGVGTNYNLNSYGYNSGYGGGYGYNPYGYGGYGGYGYPQYSYNYDSESSSSPKNSENYHYFTIPLLVTVTALKFLDIYVGPELGFKFAESKGRSLTADLNKLTAGIATGIALHLGENTKLDLRYSTDFTKVYNVEQENLKYQSFAFTVQQTFFRKLK